jgi:hypothetical protein
MENHIRDDEGAGEKVVCSEKIQIDIFCLSCYTMSEFIINLERGVFVCVVSWGM